MDEEETYHGSDQGESTEQQDVSQSATASNLDNQEENVTKAPGESKAKSVTDAPTYSEARARSVTDDLWDAAVTYAQMESGFDEQSFTEMFATDTEWLAEGDPESIADRKQPAVEEGKKFEDEDRLIGADFFDDFELTPMPEKHFNLVPNLDDPQMKMLRNDMGFRPTDVDMSQLLAADHPLLDRFQKSLKEQLLKKVLSMREEVADLEEGCKAKAVEKEVLGAEAFETQHAASKQDKTIRTCLKDLENVTAAREEMDFLYAKAIEEFQYEKDENMEVETEEISIHAEMESVDLLMKQMTNWEAELENELMINQRVMDYTAKTKVELYQQQKQLDVVIFTMMKEVWKIESEVEKVQMQLRVKEDERERLAEAVALSNIDIDSNQSEHRYLLHGWQSVLVTINQRDKYYNSLQAEYTKLDDLLSDVNSELFHIKKEIQKEHMENERLTLIKDRLDYDMKNVAKALEIEMEKREEYLKITAKYDKFIEENNKQREILRAEIATQKEEETCLARELEGINQEKYQLEQDILIHLQSNSFNSDACRQMANVLKDCKEENRRMRINIAKVEGQISCTHAEYQALAMENAEVANLLREIKREMLAEEEFFLNINRDFERSEKKLCKNILIYEQLKVKSTDDAAQKVEMWPEEVRIRQLESNNAELIEKNKQAQSFWLREQSIVVELSEKRQAQMKEIDLLKKQICVMDQKNLHINDSLENLGKLEETLSKNINAYESKMNYYTTGLHKKRNNKTALTIANQKIKSELQNKLEEGEFESLKLKAEIVEIEEDKYALSKELIDKNREALCWEKKVLMVLDTRKQMYESQSESGELSQMRIEIHRMNVRYSQLKKAQDKLIHDLDNCIYRRDSIVTLAEARTRGHKGGSQQWRVNFNKRRDDLKNKITQTEQEMENTDKRAETIIWEMSKAKEDLQLHRQRLDALKKVRDDAWERVEQAKINRQLSLDVLLYKQRKLKVYIELARGRSPHMMYKTQASAHDAYIRERARNTKLRTIVEDMQTDLPQHIHFLTKCHNSLVLPAVKL